MINFLYILLKYMLNFMFSVWEMLSQRLIGFSYAETPETPKIATHGMGLALLFYFSMQNSLRKSDLMKTNITCTILKNFLHVGKD